MIVEYYNVFRTEELILLLLLLLLLLALLLLSMRPQIWNLTYGTGTHTDKVRYGSMCGNLQGIWCKISGNIRANWKCPNPKTFFKRKTTTEEEEEEDDEKGVPFTDDWQWPSQSPDDRRRSPTLLLLFLSSLHFPLLPSPFFLEVFVSTRVLIDVTRRLAEHIISLHLLPLLLWALQICGPHGGLKDPTYHRFHFIMGRAWGSFPKRAFY